MNVADHLRVGIYGGTFAPVHNGHVVAAKAFMEQMKLDYLFIIPTCIPPHKQIDFVDDPTYRLRMCELAFKDIDGIVISDMEISRGGTSYTYDTLMELTRPNTRLFFMCGTDMVLTFDTWYRFEDIFKLCYPVYVRRENDPILTKKVVDKITEYYNKYGVMFRRILTDPIEISSTRIRKMIAQGEDISRYVSPDVKDFIFQNHIYGAGDKNEVQRENS